MKLLKRFFKIVLGIVAMVAIAVIIVLVMDTLGTKYYPYASRYCPCQ